MTRRGIEANLLEIDVLGGLNNPNKPTLVCNTPYGEGYADGRASRDTEVQQAYAAGLSDGGNKDCGSEYWSGYDLGVQEGTNIGLSTCNLAELDYSSGFQDGHANGEKAGFVSAANTFPTYDIIPAEPRLSLTSDLYGSDPTLAATLAVDKEKEFSRVETDPQDTNPEFILSLDGECWVTAVKVHGAENDSAYVDLLHQGTATVFKLLANEPFEQTIPFDAVKADQVSVNMFNHDQLRSLTFAEIEVIGWCRPSNPL